MSENLIGFEFEKSKLKETDEYRGLNAMGRVVFLQGAEQCYHMMIAWHWRQLESYKAELAKEKECRTDLETLAGIIQKYTKED